MESKSLALWKSHDVLNTPPVPNKPVTQHDAEQRGCRDHRHIPPPPPANPTLSQSNEGRIAKPTPVGAILPDPLL